MLAVEAGSAGACQQEEQGEGKDMSSALAKQRKRLKRTGMTDAQAEVIIKAINEASQAKRQEAIAMKEIAEKSYICMSIYGRSICDSEEG